MNNSKKLTADTKSQHSFDEAFGDDYYTAYDKKIKVQLPPEQVFANLTWLQKEEIKFVLRRCKTIKQYKNQRLVAANVLKIHPKHLDAVILPHIPEYKEQQNNNTINDYF